VVAVAAAVVAVADTVAVGAIVTDLALSLTAREREIWGTDSRCFPLSCCFPVQAGAR
jgi:hypothetical protein